MCEQMINIVSIGEACRLTARVNSERFRQIWEAVQKDPNVYGDPDEYHNFAVNAARIDDNYTAFQIAEKGLLQYPYNTDLLADTIHYGSNCKQYEQCENHMKTLLERPMSTWTWRAFSFLIDYLRERRDWAQNQEDIANGVNMILDIAQKYQQYYPNEERSYMAEYEARLLMSKIAKDKNDTKQANKHETAAIDLLKNLIDSGKFATVRSSLKYADILFQQQKYDEVISVCKRALEFGEVVSSVRIGYFMYLSAQSKEIQLYQAEDYGNIEKIKQIYSEYTAALAEISPNYRENIAVRAKILEARSGVMAPQAILEVG